MSEVDKYGVRSDGTLFPSISDDFDADKYLESLTSGAYDDERIGRIYEYQKELSQKRIQELMSNDKE